MSRSLWFTEGVYCLHFVYVFSVFFFSFFSVIHIFVFFVLFSIHFIVFSQFPICSFTTSPFRPGSDAFNDLALDLPHRESRFVCITPFWASEMDGLLGVIQDLVSRGLVSPPNPNHANVRIEQHILFF